MIRHHLLIFFHFGRNDRREHDLLQSLTEHEIEREQETSTLFRAASLTTTLLDLYMKSTCTEFLNAAVTDIIYKILESKQSCEVSLLFFFTYFCMFFRQ